MLEKEIFELQKNCSVCQEKNACKNSEKISKKSKIAKKEVKNDEKSAKKCKKHEKRKVFFGKWKLFENNEDCEKSEIIRHKKSGLKGGQKSGQESQHENQQKSCRESQKNLHQKIVNENVHEVLLVGNPNSGKTTLFNSLTNSDEHVGNWHGVTVENKSKPFKAAGEEFLLVDTPGLYSLCPLSFEEKVAAESILSANKKIVNLCDQNNLQRNLYLTLCLLELGLDVVVAINEIDKKPIYKIDAEKMSKMLGVSVVKINAQKKNSLEKLKEKIVEKPAQYQPPKYLQKLKIDKNRVNFDEKTAKKLNFLKNRENFLKIKAYEKDENFLQFKPEKFENFSEKPNENKNQIQLQTQNPTQSQKENAKNNKHQSEQSSMEFLANLRYEYIDEILASCAQKTEKTYGSSKLDKIFLNKYFSLVCFVAVMFGIFYLTFFSVGAFLSDALSSLLSLACSPILNAIGSSFGQGMLYEFFSVALFGGLSTVLTFLPQITLLFFFLSLLEDSGYMSRIAFIFEDILSRIGLSGKSVYTLLMGFGCSTTAIMTSRNMEEKNSKIKTALLCPYMSCSAKIPIYTVIGGAFFGANNIFVIVGLYFLGLAVAVLISKLLNSTVLKSQNQSFILEFPPYRMVSFSRTLKILWKNIREFLVRVGSVMIAVNVIVWVLSNFSFSLKYVADFGGVSILESLGKILAPLFAPLGFGNWAVVCALLAGFVAKEVVVSSIAMFNGIDAGATRLIGESVLLSTSAVYFVSNASAISFLVFCLLYTPCVSSVAMLLQEVGQKWTWLGVCLQFFAAYVIAFVVYNFCFAIEIFGFFAVFCVFFAIFAVIFSVFLIFRIFRKKKFCSRCSDNNCPYFSFRKEK